MFRKWSRVSTLIIISEVHASPQIFAILRDSKKSNLKFRVIFFGMKNSPLFRDLMQLECDLILKKPLSKYKIIKNIPFLLINLMRIRPYTVLCSGFLASAAAMPLSLLLGIPERIYIRHHSNLHSKYHLRMGLFVDKLTALTATKIVAVSKVVLDIVKSELNSNTQKVIQISNGIDIEKFGSKERGRNVLANKNEIIIGTIARQTDWKGLQYTAESFVNLHLINSNTRFHLVGAPADATGEIMQILSNLDSNCYQIDESVQDVSDFFNSIDIFVHVPVGKLEEAFGLVYIEALASGVQCVFTKSGVLNEIPEIETYASIVDYENSEEILEAILGISSKNSITYPPFPQKILQEYSLDSMSKKYVQLLRNGRN